MGIKENRQTLFSVTYTGSIMISYMRTLPSDTARRRYYYYRAEPPFGSSRRTTLPCGWTFYLTEILFFLSFLLAFEVCPPAFHRNDGKSKKKVRPRVGSHGSQICVCHFEQVVSFQPNQIMTAIIQRPLRGSRISTFYPVKNLPSLASLDSAFQLQEYISLLIRLDVHDVNVIVSLPGNASGKDREKEKEKEPWVVVEGGGGSERKEKEDVDVDKGKGEPTVDEACWIYEQLRYVLFSFLSVCLCR